MADTASVARTRSALQRVAAHVLGRRRHDVVGRFGLRASAGGFATPAFGDDAEVLRVAGAALVRETAAGAAYIPLHGSTLRSLARFAGVDLTAPFSVGADTPDLGEIDAPVDIDPEVAAGIADWFAVGWRALDGVLVGLPSTAAPAVLQLWPEHFDAGTNVAVGGDQRCNLGISPGDGFSEEPYAYVGPWSDDRPGDAAYWNAAFGAVLQRSAVTSAAQLERFFLEGLTRLNAPGAGEARTGR